MSNRESVTLSREQEERLVKALGLIVESEPVSVLAPHRDTPFWRRPMVVPALAFLAVLAVFLPFRLADNAPNDTPANSGTVQGTTEQPSGASEFSPGAAEEMEVASAEYPFDVDEWSASTQGATQLIAELGEEEITVQLVDLVRDSASEVLAGVDAAPPYDATIVSAFQTDGAWNVLATATFADGECLVVVDRGSLGFHECRSNGSDTPDPVMLDGDYERFTVLSQDVSFAVGDWVSVMWWGLPQEASAVRYRATSEAATSDDSVTPVLGGMIRISLEVQGVDQQFSIEALGTDDQTLLEDSIQIPAFGESGDVLVGTPTRIEYEADAAGFQSLVGDDDTFLGGGYVNGEPWAIVGRSLVAEGKPTLECSGVRPIIDEDVCDDLDGLGWMALPVGETGGGVLVIRSSQDADYVRINYEDGTASEAAFIGPDDGYPPVAVIPVEAPGASGTMHAITDNGDVLWSQPFTVTEIVNPGG